MQGCPSGMFGGGQVTLSEGLTKLVSEHLPLRNTLNTLFSLCCQIEENQGEAFNKLIHEVKEFKTNLDFHSVREEDILFRMMETYIGRNGGPIAVMEYEHEMANKYISEFLKKAEVQAQLSTDEIIKNVQLIKDAYNTLLEHFQKEENVLYPMAERLFSETEKEILNQKVSENK